jgi:hypothetical protein
LAKIENQYLKKLMVESTVVPECNGSSGNKHVLILGGSSFMGLELLETLSSMQSVKTYFINRGKIYW